MPVFRLDERLVFPHPELADPDGLLAVGGDLRPERLLLAYSHGIFPWYSEGQPILWHSPDPRAVLPVRERHVPRSLGKTMRRGGYRVTYDTAFDQVMAACGTTPRPHQRGTWITREMKRAYGKLHELGYAHSAEAWDGERLCGGLYGVSIGGAFFGESMFAHAEDASKVAFVRLLESLEEWGIELVDCQMPTPHLERFGAIEWSRGRFLRELAAALEKPTKRGRWEP